MGSCCEDSVSNTPWISIRVFCITGQLPLESKGCSVQSFDCSLLAPWAPHPSSKPLLRAPVPQLHFSHLNPTCLGSAKHYFNTLQLLSPSATLSPEKPQLCAFLVTGYPGCWIHWRRPQDPVGDPNDSTVQSLHCPQSCSGPPCYLVIFASLLMSLT